MEVPPGSTARELAQALNVPLADVIRALLAAGATTTATQALTDDEVAEVGRRFGRPLAVSDDAPPVPPPDPAGLIAYALHLRLETGAKTSGTLITRRPRTVGELVNLPDGPDGVARPGRGSLWRVTAVDPAKPCLELTFERSTVD